LILSIHDITDLIATQVRDAQFVLSCLVSSRFQLAS
jgi:hypothetical protein